MTPHEYNLSVKEFNNRVCRFVDKILMDRNIAKDITQEAYLKLWEKLDTVQFSKVRAWLFTTVYRLSMDHINRQKRFVSEDYYPQSFTETENPDLKQIIEDSLKLLNEVQRSVLLLRDYEGYSYEEIGEVMNLNEPQVKVYLFRARKTIKNYIGDLGFVL